MQIQATLQCYSIWEDFKRIQLSRIYPTWFGHPWRYNLLREAFLATNKWVRIHLQFIVPSIKEPHFAQSATDKDLTIAIWSENDSATFT